MKLRSLILTALCILTCSFYASAQSKDTTVYPEAGKPMPDFVLRNIAYYSKKTATLNDFKGKWLILDFWNKGCGACVASFPYMSALQKELGDKLQVMMVGIQDRENQIRPMYAKFRQKEKLIMPCAFDSLLSNRFAIWDAPHTIIIDDKGIVRAVTVSVNAADMKTFLAGGTPKLIKTYRKMGDDEKQAGDSVYAFDETRPFLTRNNGGNDTDFIFRSLISKWSRVFHKQYYDNVITADNIKTGKFEALGVPLKLLYNIAFWGQNGWGIKDTIHYGSYYPQAILEIKDSTNFKYNYNTSTAIFSYSLIMPKARCTKASIQSALQNELQSCFGYAAAIETRNCPYWKLVSKKGASKLKTKGTPYSWAEMSHAGIKATNVPFSEVTEWLAGAVNGDYFSDETGITGNVDIALDCIPGHIEDVKQALAANGLELVRAEKPMKVLVIRDPR